MENILLNKVIEELKAEIVKISEEMDKCNGNHWNYLNGLRLAKKNVLVDLAAIKFDLAHPTATPEQKQWTGFCEKDELKKGRCKEQCSECWEFQRK